MVKAPKLYFRDTGLLHALLGVRSSAELLVHPKLGASWEGFALETILRITEPDAAYFYAVHSGSELDLLMLKNGRRLGVEFKRADAPKLTRSMQVALDDLALDELWIIYPGIRDYALTERVMVRSLESCLRNETEWHRSFQSGVWECGKCGRHWRWDIGYRRSVPIGFPASIFGTGGANQ